VRAVRVALLVVVASCGADAPSREQRIIETLADDNILQAEREPALVALKLRKMQRGPYEWLRGTASLYWRDLMEPGAARAITTFGDAPSSRVLLIGDSHPENVGTFRGFSDAQMFVDWNDFDATGYGPFTGDVRRLVAGFVVIAELGAPGDVAFASELSKLAAGAYARQVAAIASSPAAMAAIAISSGNTRVATARCSAALTRRRVTTMAVFGVGSMTALGSGGHLFATFSLQHGGHSMAAA
jgi:uncharacterized protein (DUF2252 family)